MLTIVENDTPRWASNAAVEAHVSQQLGGQHSMQTISRWDEAFRNGIGVYTPWIIRQALDAYQDHDGGTLSFADGKVTVTYAAVDLSLDRAKEQALAQIAARRYQAETGGVEVNGIPVATDRDSQGKYTAARIIAKEDATYTVNWKTDAGFQTFDAATLIAVADAVRAHIQACFDREAALASDINDATDLDALRAIDLEAGWPANPSAE